MAVSGTLESLLEQIEQFPMLTQVWHRRPVQVQPATSLGDQVVLLHALNFSLWHHEDQARRLDIPDCHVVRHKRAIDRDNADRNATIEQLDSGLLELLPPTRGRLRTETPAMIVDRMSVLALRTFHFKNSTQLEGSKERQRALQLLDQQARELNRSLQKLLNDVCAGRARFAVYRQFKSGKGQYCPLFEGEDKWLTSC